MWTCRRGVQGVRQGFFEAASSDEEARRRPGVCMTDEGVEAGLNFSTHTDFRFGPNSSGQFHVATTMAGPKQASQTTTASVSNPVSVLWKSYLNKTPDRLKFIDAFLTFLVLSGVFQFIYCVLVTNFPFNAFLAGYAIVPVSRVF